MSTRTSGSRSPFTVTSATPATAASRSSISSSTSLVRSWIDMLLAVTASRMMASELSSALTMVTSSTSSGSWRSTLPTTSRRSLAATLRSIESSNSTTMRRRAGAARRGDRLHARHARCGALQDARDLGVDRLRRGAVIGGADGDDRAVDVRQLADLDAAEGGEPGDDDEEVEDDRRAPGGGRRAPTVPASPSRA